MPALPSGRAASVALIVLAALTLAALFAVLRPTASGPQDRSFEITVPADAMTPRDVTVSEGDRVTLRISADREIGFHLHGYDLKAAVRPGVPAVLEFRADLTGRFEIEDEETERPLGTLVVEPR